MFVGTLLKLSRREKKYIITARHLRMHGMGALQEQMDLQRVFLILFVHASFGESLEEAPEQCEKSQYV